ncbi:MAG: TraM recognition domain-containing protein [bacterium]|nr:TraM recognition domain-containing protein [bacterium]
MDFRKLMDEGKILLIKLPKGKLQEEIMGFLGAMFVTKLFQAAMGRQSIEKNQRKPFFLYVDEFQNFSTETFNEILSEARKYGLSLCVAHQFIKQIPSNLSDSLFGNVGTMISFRVSSDDAEIIKNHYAPFLSGYDLSNLNMREFYCKLLVKGEIKDPFSLKSRYIPDAQIDSKYIDELYTLSRAKYARTLEEAKQVVETKIKDVEKTLEEFAEPLI